MLSIIVAHDKDYAIGYQGWMPWNLKEDLRQFKKRTLHHTIVMGLKTFETIKKPLPDRKTVIVCYPEEAIYKHEAIEYCHDFKQFLIDHENTEEEIFICGGASIYKQAFPYCKKLYISLVDGTHPADTWLYRYDPNDYDVASKTPYEGFTLIEYVKKV